MSKEFSLSGMGLGIYLLGLGITYLLETTLHFPLFNFWFRLYPLLIVLLGLDYLLCGLNGSSCFNKPNALIAGAIIVVTIIGFTAPVISGPLRMDLHKIERFRHSFQGPDLFHHGRQRSLHKVFKVPPGVTTARIVNSHGEIIVNSSPGDAITVKITGYARFDFPKKKQFDLTTQAQGDLYIIKLNQPKTEHHFRRMAGLKVTLEVTVPENVAVEIKNSAGAVHVLNVRNNLSVETAAGELNVDNAGRNLTVASRLGAIKIGTVHGDADINSHAGQITVARIDGRAKVESSLGEVILKDCRGPVTADVKTGQLKVNLTAVNGICDLESKMGSIELGVPADAKFSVDAETEMGDINSNFTLAYKRGIASAAATADINGGGPLVKIKAHSGSIWLKKM
ncbi:MAG: DUF4097 family beta strand repeat-containing protein [Bacillota bacterium]